MEFRNRALPLLAVAAMTAAAGVHSADNAATGHPAAHGGSLNAIEECGVGHLEVTVENDSMRVWFVGGDTETLAAVRVAAGSIPLVATADGGRTLHTLTLEAAPLALAGETAGNCSHFKATAPWLRDVDSFTAVGLVIFKGRLRVLRIEYPKGYDPDEGHEDHDHVDGHDQDDDDDHVHDHDHGH